MSAETWQTQLELEAYLAGRPLDELIQDASNALRAYQDGQRAAEPAVLPWEPPMAGPYELWLPTERKDRPRMSRRYSQPYEPKPQPLEGPDELNYERIVRLEWECGLRSGDIDAYYADVGAAQQYDLELRRELVRRDDAARGRVGRVGKRARR